MCNLQRYSQVLICLFYALVTSVHGIHHLDSHLGNIVLSCGSSSNWTTANGREWISDTDSSLISLHLGGSSVKSIPRKDVASEDLPSAPYRTARASRQWFMYRFAIEPGQKFIRLHFYSTLYKGFERSKAFFTVKAGSFILLDNFSPEIAAQALGQQNFVKEFCINVEPNQALNITFFPSAKVRSYQDFYAFINGIEIVSMPSGLYFTREGHQGAQVVDEGNKAYISNTTALEMVQRLNIGGNPILHLEDSGMFRRWDDDSKYILESGHVTVNLITRYPQTPVYFVPLEIYQTARSTGSTDQLKMQNLIWRIPVDSGFRYLVRFHICDLNTMMTESVRREFSITINNVVAENKAEADSWIEGNGAAYKDFIIAVTGNSENNKQNLLICIQPKVGFHGLLNGLEIFKLSNLDNALDSSYFNHVHHLQISAVGITTKLQESLSSRMKKEIEEKLVLVVTLMIIVGYCLRLLSDTDFGVQKVRSSTQSHRCHEFTLREVLAATKHFNTELLIGQGGFGLVYKGLIKIHDRQIVVAIKRLKFMSRQGVTEFWAEIKSLSRLQHKHLVSLIGFCREDQELILIYEYMPRGSLADQIHKEGTSASILSWQRRLEISIDVAHGLRYIHTCENKVIHRDLKSSNILLAEDWVAKISDFGLCKIEPTNESLTHFSSIPKGTLGYLDPEYYTTNKLTRKSDVYAFGVVLVELLSGRKAFDSTLKEDQRILATWAPWCIREGKFDKIIDRNIKGQISPACLSKFLDIIYKCLRLLSDERPSVAEVLESLETALALQLYAMLSNQYIDDKKTISLYPELMNRKGLDDLLPPLEHQKVTTTGERRSRFSTRGLVQFQLSPSSVIRILKGDITQWSVDGSTDAIVNPTQERLLGHRVGADAAIHRAAGPKLEAECYKIPEVMPGVRCPVGEARITPGFKLAASNVIHTVGPVYGFDLQVERLLKNAYRNSLQIAKKHNIQYVAFTAISCGAGRYPYDEGATIAISTVKEFASAIKEVHFIMLLDEAYDVWVKKAIDLLS